MHAIVSQSPIGNIRLLAPGELNELKCPSPLCDSTLITSPDAVRAKGVGGGMNAAECNRKRPSFSLAPPLSAHILCV